MEQMLLVAGSSLLGVGFFALVGSLAMEIKFKEPIHMVAMKISLAVFTVGGAIFTAACAMGVLS